MVDCAAFIEEPLLVAGNRLSTLGFIRSLGDMMLDIQDAAYLKKPPNAGTGDDV
jgi:hypothetical protein